MFKHYSSKSAAAKGAARNNLEASKVYQNAEGLWGFDVVEAGEPVAPAPDAAPQQETHPLLEAAGYVVDTQGATVPKRTIEKDREERNGVKRPSAGGMCRSVWDWCDANVTGNTIPSAKQVKEAATQHAWNANNASIEYYNWRKFMGVRARSTTLPE